MKFASNQSFRSSQRYRMSTTVDMPVEGGGGVGVGVGSESVSRSVVTFANNNQQQPTSSSPIKAAAETAAAATSSSSSSSSNSSLIIASSDRLSSPVKAIDHFLELFMRIMTGTAYRDSFLKSIIPSFRAAGQTFFHQLVSYRPVSAKTSSSNGHSKGEGLVVAIVIICLLIFSPIIPVRLLLLLRSAIPHHMMIFVVCYIITIIVTTCYL